MADDELFHRINDLVAEEHRLEGQDEIGDDARARIRQIDVMLDQCWDLLRQRRARRQYDQDPSGAQVRDADTVERYQQ